MVCLNDTDSARRALRLPTSKRHRPGRSEDAIVDVTYAFLAPLAPDCFLNVNENDRVSRSYDFIVEKIDGSPTL